MGLIGLRKFISKNWSYVFESYTNLIFLLFYSLFSTNNLLNYTLFTLLGPCHQFFQLSKGTLGTFMILFLKYIDQLKVNFIVCCILILLSYLGRSTVWLYDFSYSITNNILYRWKPLLSGKVTAQAFSMKNVVQKTFYSLNIVRL